ncbi:zinc finger CCCH domain-containing protein 18 isoform X2 [Ricinus communis]|uniref:zinc finger CCCH domain-containing protein 18 isoform X2 n=1 Tax=Ricinus communis TaxID=3988 RepID=UPI00201A49C3|nr:zinc finger CCCH domain-containing protein 18 isoform X2 [Ricinus communis]
MASEEEERALEKQLELQLEEQKDSLAALNDALASDPSNHELLSVQEELVQAIKDAEDGLLHLKRARLLREVDSALHDSKDTGNDVKIEPLDSDEVGAEPLEEHSHSVGSKCRFRHNDGRWYNGVDVPLSSLRTYIPTMWDQSMVGSSIWAVSDSNAGIWREAELESWDDKLRVGKVVFRDDGSSAELESDSMNLSEHALRSDEEESHSSSEQSDSSDYEEESAQGLGFLESSTLQRGIQTETAIFARWENHTRGIASKMMANMGYRDGMGLGASGQGMVDPISVKVLPPKQSLDHALQSQKEEEIRENHGKKRSRGGKRKREKKLAALAKEAKEEEEMNPDVFSLINIQLAKHNEALNGGSKTKQHHNKVSKKVDRRVLIAYDDEMKELRLRAEKLEEMASRNKKEKVVYEAAMRKLNETRKALAEAEAAHASASNAVVSKEKEKKWLKF